MRAGDATNVVTLIPPTPQMLWGKPAVANFVLGGLGAGFYVVALAVDRAVAVASWLGPALVLAGFACVAAEAGRPLRGPRVLARVRTSWMSRELWIGGAFALLAAGGLALPLPGTQALAALAAVTLALAQGLILRHARGVAAWDVPVMPVVFLASSLVSGAALLILIEVLAGRPAGGGLLGSTLVLLALGALVWLAFVTWSSAETFAQPTRLLREGVTAVTIVGAGYVAPFVLLALPLAGSRLERWAATLAALGMLAGQVAAKAALLLGAGRLRPITLGNLRLERSRVAPLSGHPRLEPVSRHPLQRRVSP